MYNTSYKCVKPLTLWYDGPDGKRSRTALSAEPSGILSGVADNITLKNSQDQIKCTWSCRMSMSRNISKRYEHG